VLFRKFSWVAVLEGLPPFPPRTLLGLALSGAPPAGGRPPRNHDAPTLNIVLGGKGGGLPATLPSQIRSDQIRLDQVSDLFRSDQFISRI
jgi:hypothetical protein